MGGNGAAGVEGGGGGVATSSGDTLTPPPVPPVTAAQQQQQQQQYHLQSEAELHQHQQDVLLQSRLYPGTAFNVGYQNPVFDLEQGDQVDHQQHQQQGKGRRWSLRRNNSGRFDSVRRVCPAPSTPR